MGSLRLPDEVRTIPEVLAYWARERPDAPALIGPGDSLVTYGELAAAVDAMAGTLASCGVARESIVPVMLEDGPLSAVALLGAASAAVAFPVAVSTPVDELERLASRLDVGGVIVAPDLPAAARECFDRLGAKVFCAVVEGATLSLIPETRTNRSGPSLTPARPSDVAKLSQTSGTTGRAKLVPRRHEQVADGGRTHRDFFGMGVEDRAVAVTPLSLSLGMTTLLHTICSGMSLVFPSSLTLAQVWLAIERFRPTWLNTSAGFLELLARDLRAKPKSPPSSLRFIRVTAASISPAVIDEVEAALGAPVLPAYSTSETGMVAATLPRHGWRKAGSVGRPVQDVSIVDAAGNVLPSGEEGEIWIRGKKLIGGYVDDPELNARAFLADGWFRIGDTGYVDEDGFLFITGRVNELINRGGVKISPAEVDSVLLAHPAVREAAVFAVPDDRLGEDIVAAVILEPAQSISARELRGWLLNRLERHKVPRRIWFIGDATLPRTSSGKVRRTELTSRFREYSLKAQ